MLAAEMVAKSEFLRKFENRISIVGRDGTAQKLGEQPADSGASSVDASLDNGGAITVGNLHPALADALFGSAAPEPRKSHASLNFVPSPSRRSRDSVGSFVPAGGQRTVVPPPAGDGTANG